MGIANSLSAGIYRTLLLTVLLLAGLQVSGQAWLDRPVSINATDESRSSLLFQVSEQADIGLAFNTSLPQFKERITINATRQPARAVLDLILAGTFLT